MSVWVKIQPLDRIVYTSRFEFILLPSQNWRQVTATPHIILPSFAKRRILGKTNLPLYWCQVARTRYWESGTGCSTPTRMEMLWAQSTEHLGGDSASRINMCYCLCQNRHTWKNCSHISILLDVWKFSELKSSHCHTPYHPAKFCQTSYTWKN